MADEAHNQIDRVYDFAERAVEGIGRVLGVDVSTPIKGKVELADRRAARALPPATPAQRALPAPTRPWEVVEALDSGTGAPVFVVTNGVESADCKSREFAEQVLAAMTSLGAATPQLAAAAPTAEVSMGNGRGRRR